MGKWLIFFGLVLLVAGILVQLGVDFSWIGKLPGDIRIKSGSTMIYLPIMTCLVLSLILSVLIYPFGWLG